MLFSSDAFADKVVVVTGAARGIGRAIAQAFSRVGACIAVVDLNGDTANCVTSQMRKDGCDAIAITADVASETGVSKMMDGIVSKWGTVHVLVNNVGIYPRQPFEQMKVDDWEHVINVNLRSAFLCAKACAPFMMHQRWGRIINIASVRFWIPDRGLIHYVAAKGGVIGLTRALAHELGDYGITVNAIAPGAVETEAERNACKDNDRRKRMVECIIQAQCIKRRLHPFDIAWVAVFLASDEAGAITGQTILVDAGWAMD